MDRRASATDNNGNLSLPPFTPIPAAVLCHGAPVVMDSSSPPPAVASPAAAPTSSSMHPAGFSQLCSASTPAEAPAPPSKNPEDDGYDMNYDRSESLPSNMTVDSVTKYEDQGSVDGPKPNGHKRKKGIPVSPKAAKRGRGDIVCRANELLKHDGVAEQIDSRSISVSPLPYNVKLEDVQSFFAQHGKVNNVRLPEHVSDKRYFCGTALVEFSEVMEANSVREKKLSFAGAELEIKQKKELDTEREAKTEAYEKLNTNKNSVEGYPKGLILAFKLKKIRAHRDVEPNGFHKVDIDTVKKEGASSSAMEWATGHEEKVPENTDVREEKSDAVELSASDTLSLNKDSKGPSDNDKKTITKEEVREYFTKFGAVRYVHFSKGGDSGYLRFEESKAVEKACALASLSDEGGLTVKGHLVTLEPLSASCYKELLQQFSLRKYRELPIYISRSESEPRDTKFWCIVELNGQHFKSLHLHARKKEAEQDAAKVAFEFLMPRDGENFVDVMTLIDKGLLFCKSILSEFSSKKKINQPIYSFQRQQGLARMTFSTATVCIGGQEYTGGMSKSKKAAAEKAACVAAKLILDTNDECMLNIFRSKKRFVAATAPDTEPRGTTRSSDLQL